MPSRTSQTLFLYNTPARYPAAALLLPGSEITGTAFFCSVPLVISASPAIPFTFRNSTLTPICDPSFCTALFYVTVLSIAYPLMQDAVSAIKTPVCRHFRLCPVFTWTSLLSQQVGSTPSSFTCTITVCSHRGHKFLACPVSSHMNTDTRSSQFFIVTIPHSILYSQVFLVFRFQMQPFHP